MIESLAIEGLGVIDTAEIEPHTGLTVLTGETGAGKTMVLSGLSLVLGNRPDPGQVRRGVPRAAVTAVVHLDPADPVLGRVEDAGGQTDNGALVLFRTVSPEGRSRAHAGGTTVPAALLAEIADRLVTVHGQADQRRLLRADRQRELLDAYADRLLGPPALVDGAAPESGAGPLARYRVARARWLADSEERDRLVATRETRLREAEVLRHGLAEVEAADPLAGEDEALAVEQQRLTHAEALADAVQAARDALTGDAGVTDLLASPAAALDRAAEHDPGLAGMVAGLRELTVLARDLAADLSSHLAGLEPDPARLAEIGSRRDLLARLSRRWSSSGRSGADGEPGTAALLRWAQDARERLAGLADDDQRIAELQRRSAAGREEVAGLATALAAHRAHAAAVLGAAVSVELAALAMPRAVVSVRLDPVWAAPEDPWALPAGPADEADAGDTGVAADAGRRTSGAGGTTDDGDRSADPERRWVRAGAHGTETVELLLTPHPGAPARPLDEGASGGELSRVMLAVEVVAADAAPTPTFVFDEIDAGIGGATALEVGRRLSRLARRRQVIVVTHLAQVAVYADRHLAVTKDQLGAVTRTGVRVIAGGDRLAELARMLGGHAESGAARAHVTELLAQAQRETADDAEPRRAGQPGGPTRPAATPAGPPATPARPPATAAAARRGSRGDRSATGSPGTRRV